MRLPGEAFAAEAAPPAGTAAAMGPGIAEDDEAVLDMPEIVDVWSPAMAVVPISLPPGAGREGTLLADGAAGGEVGSDAYILCKQQMARQEVRCRQAHLHA